MIQRRIADSHQLGRDSREELAEIVQHFQPVLLESLKLKKARAMAKAYDQWLDNTPPSRYKSRDPSGSKQKPQQPVVAFAWSEGDLPEEGRDSRASDAEKCTKETNTTPHDH